MTKKNFIQVFEFQKLKVGDGGFNEHHFASLVKFNEKNSNKYFTPIYNGIQFKSYVGVIHVGGLTIEILPKSDREHASEAVKNRWQKILLNMLKVCRYIQVDNVSETGLEKKYNSILEVYFEIFIAEVEHLMKQGLIKKYRCLQSNQLALRGKLVFSQNIQKNLIHQERFYCENQVYDKDHTIHQILFQALRILDDIVSQNLKDRVKRLLFEFHDFNLKEFKARQFENLSLNRKSKPYGKALDISKMIILNYSPNLNSGQDNMLTLLFDMNKLWEEYIYIVLKRNCPTHFEISSQAQNIFWEQKTIRPDIVIRDVETQRHYIIDTKWKIVDSSSPSDDDLKQMFTYNLYWKADRSILLYPGTGQSDSGFGKYHYQHYHITTSEYGENLCKIGFVDLIKDGAMKEEMMISGEIFQKMFE